MHAPSIRLLAPLAIAAALVALAVILWLTVFSPSPASASGTVLSVISGQVFVQPSGAQSRRPVVDGETLRQGDRVITGDDGRAVVTFFEGSTQTIEPNTDITLQSLGSTGDGGLLAHMKQAVGQTYNNVFRTSPGGSEYSVDTPAASAAVRDTMFQVSVGAGGETDVWTRQGTVGVSALGVTQNVPAGKADTTSPGSAPRAPQPAPVLAGQIAIDFTSDGWLAARSPDRFISGEAPAGVPVNQIPLAIISDPSTKPQSLTLPALESGIYSLFYTTSAATPYHMAVLGASGTFPICALSQSGALGASESWRADLTVDVENGSLVSCSLGAAARTDENPFARLVIPNGLEFALRNGQLLIPNLSVLGASASPPTTGSVTPDAGLIGQPSTQPTSAGDLSSPTQEPSEDTPTVLPIASPAASAVASPSLGAPTPIVGAGAPAPVSAGPTNTAVPTPSPTTPPATATLVPTLIPTFTPLPTSAPPPTATPTPLVVAMALSVAPNPASSQGVINLSLDLRNVTSQPVNVGQIVVSFPAGATFLSSSGVTCVPFNGVLCSPFQLGANDNAPGGRDELSVQLSIQVPAVSTLTSALFLVTVLGSQSPGAFGVLTAANISVTITPP